MTVAEWWRSGRQRLATTFAFDPACHRKWTLFGILAFSAIYLAAYASEELVPNGSSTARGWEAWHDQGQYLRSARAFAEGNLASSEHWFPPGYSLLAAPFVHLTPVNPFVIPNYLCFALYLLGFMRLTRTWLPPPLALGCFALGTLCPPFLLSQYIFPWNTIPIAALFVWLLVMIDESLRDERWQIDFAIGLLVGLMAAIRQIEVVIVVPAGIVYLAHRLARRKFANLAIAAVPAAIPAVLIACLVLKISGTLSTPYVKAAAKFGFSLSGFFQRATFLLLDATIYGEPHAALRSFQPFVVAMLPACAIAAVLAWRRFGLAAATCFMALAVYISYGDFSPINIVRFYLVHYIEWIFPIVLACGVAAWIGMLRERRWGWATITGFATLALLSAHTTVVPDTAYKVRQLPGVECGFELEAENPQQIQAIDFVGAPQEHTRVDAVADGQSLVEQHDYDHVLTRGFRVVVKSYLAPKVLDVSLPAFRNAHCSPDLIRVSRYPVSLDFAGAIRNLFAAPDDGSRMFPAEAMARQIGYVTAANGKTFTTAGSDEEGYVAYGPYEDLPPGYYTATFDFSANGAAPDGRKVVFEVEADDGHGSLALAVRGSADGPQRVTLPFQVTEQVKKLQYRMLKPKGYGVRFVSVSVARMNESEAKRAAAEQLQTRRIPVEAMTRQIGSIQTDGKGTANLAGTKDEDGFLAYGPFEYLPDGDYVAEFMLSAAAPVGVAGSVGVDVATGDGSKVLAAATFAPQDDVRGVAVPFTKDANARQLQYRVYKPRGYAVHFYGVSVRRIEQTSGG